MFNFSPGSDIGYRFRTGSGCSSGRGKAKALLRGSDDHTQGKVVTDSITAQHAKRQPWPLNNEICPTIVCMIDKALIKYSLDKQMDR